MPATGLATPNAIERAAPTEANLARSPSFFWHHRGGSSVAFRAQEHASDEQDGGEQDAALLPRSVSHSHCRVEVCFSMPWSGIRWFLGQVTKYNPGDPYHPWTIACCNPDASFNSCCVDQIPSEDVRNSGGHGTGRRNLPTPYERECMYLLGLCRHGELRHA